MGNNVPPKAPPPHEPIPENEGFFANRWRMAKAGAKSVFTYLTSPKTWLLAAGFAGAGLAMHAFFPGNTLIFSHMEPGIGGAAAYAAKMLTIGTMIHMGIDMFKEGRLKGYHPDGQPAPDPGQLHCQEPTIGNYQAQAQSYEPQNYRLEDGVAPPPMTPPGAQSHPNQPNIPDR